MNILVRQVSEEDFSFVFSLASDAVKYQVSPLRENLNMEKARENYLRDLEIVSSNLSSYPNSHFLIAISEGEKAGFLLLATDVSESTTGIEQAWIFDIAFYDHYWESDVPHKLLDYAEDLAREKGLHHIALQLVCSHEKALNFFKSRGYEEERKRMYKKLPFEAKESDTYRKDLLKALEGIKFKFNIKK
jgi:GNAT superfamily N-acetyltransferase